jgi:flagellar hook protein FlgE
MQISGNAFSSGFSGIQAGQQRIDRAAGDIASQSARAKGVEETSTQVRENDDLARSLVDMRTGKQDVQINSKVVETADDVLGTLIDTRA